jgi:hypothetical protein
MPSRGKSVVIDSLPPSQFGPNVDYQMVRPGRAAAQVAVLTLAATAAGLVGLRIGPDGDPLRLNAQGQVFQLDGADAVGGVWLVWLGPAVPTGLVELGIAGD